LRHKRSIDTAGVTLQAFDFVAGVSQLIYASFFDFITPAQFAQHFPAKKI